ncbi:hypothetical protein [Kitasatospora sp. NPDC093679]|uniref:hypothetical protein n=1 Tax=Kitasatospora sp. NPDC093679 TaxID=3154983 RepID=UPI00344154D2
MDITSQIDVPTVIAAGAAGQCADVRVESAAAVMAAVVLDQCAVLSAGQPRAEAAGVVADGLRAALMDAGIRTAAGEPVSAGARADEFKPPPRRSSGCPARPLGSARCVSAGAHGPSRHAGPMPERFFARPLRRLRRAWRRAARALRRRFKLSPPPADSEVFGSPDTCRCDAVPTRHVLGNGTVVEVTSHAPHCPVWRLGPSAPGMAQSAQPPSSERR